MADELYSAEATATDPLQACVTALLAVRGGGSRQRALQVLRSAAAVENRSPVDAGRLAGCAAHVHRMDPWAPVAELDAAKGSGWKSTPDPDGTLGAWVDVLKVAGLRLAGRVDETRMALGALAEQGSALHGTIQASASNERADQAATRIQFVATRRRCAPSSNPAARRRC